MATANARSAETPAASSTATVKSNAPPAVGVPASDPLLESATPGGSAPLATRHAYGVVPPDAASVAAYGVPAAPDGKALVTIESGAAATRSVRAAVAVFVPLEASAARTVNVAVAACVGVPAIVPEALSVSPAGSCPDAMLHV